MRRLISYIMGISEPSRQAAHADAEWPELEREGGGLFFCGQRGELGKGLTRRENAVV